MSLNQSERTGSLFFSKNVGSWPACSEAHSEQDVDLQTNLQGSEFQVPSTSLLDKCHRWRLQATVHLLEKEGALQAALLLQANRLSRGLSLAARKAACRLRGVNI